jgi:5-oxopent-3-ene-1,2,5-tricarboxylate decarboxylase/2-hydroxyhepta-2,4-diene-1,7-dioate isomerase
VAEYRRILLDGACVQVVRDGDWLVAGDGRRVDAATAVHLPPVVPTKIVAVHLNHHSRVREFGARLPAAPTYFHKPSPRSSATAARWSGLPTARTSTTRARSRS